jgi:hypothetical protein
LTHLRTNIHFYRGICRTPGIFGVKRYLDEIWEFERSADETDDEVQGKFQESFKRAEKEYTIVNAKLRAFYRSE